MDRTGSIGLPLAYFARVLAIYRHNTNRIGVYRFFTPTQELEIIALNPDVMFRCVVETAYFPFTQEITYCVIDTGLS
jgi:hypothetical protein